MELTEKRIVINQAEVDAKGRSMGETQKLLAMRKNSLAVLLVKALHTKEELSFKADDIKAINLYMEKDAANKSVVGRAIVGGVLTGGIGALVGGLSGTGKADAWYVEIETKENNVYVYRLQKADDRTALIKWCNKHGL